MQTTDSPTGLRRAVDDAIARSVAIGGLVAIALIHVLQLPAAFAAIGYLGALFVAAAAACLVLAAALACTSDDRVWAATGGLAGLLLVGYVLSRSVGLPGFTDDIGEWSEPRALAALVVESLEVVLTCAVLASRSQPRWRAAGSTAAGGMQPAAG